MSVRQPRTQEPYSLTDEMLGSAPVITARRPYRVLAWVPHPDGQRHIRAEATAWNDRPAPSGQGGFRRPANWGRGAYAGAIGDW